MSLDITIAVAYEFAVRAPFKDVFAVLADVPTSAGFFPHVDRLVDLGKGVYRWDMQPVGTREFNFRTVYASRYVSHKAKGTVVWTPVEGIGNAAVGGSWSVVRGKESTALTLDIDATLHTAFPALLHVVVEPLMRSEFERLVERYIDNLIGHFGGEA